MGPVITKAFDLVAKTDDARAGKLLDEMLAEFFTPKKGDSTSWRDHLEKHARRAVKVRAGLSPAIAIGPAVKAQVAACTDACKALLAGDAVASEADVLAQSAAAPKTDGVLDDLLAAVLRDPDDDHARAVYGDALQQRGDPRGEFIALQLGPRSAAAEARERALLKQHGRTWLGPLDAAIKPDSIRFARGFLDACRVEFKTKSQRDELHAHPWWATATEIDCNDQAFLLEPGLVSLRRATLTTESLATLAARKRPVPLEAVIGLLEMSYGIRMRYGMAPRVARHWGAALHVGSLVHLRSLQLRGWSRDHEPPALTPTGLRWLLDSKLGRQLAELDLMPQGDEECAIAPWIDELARRRDALRVIMRFTNSNTASGSTNILVVFELVPNAAGTIDVTMSLNNDMADIRYLTIGRQIDAALAKLPNKHAPKVTVRYIGSKKRTKLGFPTIAERLNNAFKAVTLE
jgi:uncharacterized protein (TIGR02996 family)